MVHIYDHRDNERSINLQSTGGMCSSLSSTNSSFCMLRASMIIYKSVQSSSEWSYAHGEELVVTW